MVAELKAKTKTPLAAASPSSSRIEPVEFDEFNDAAPPGPGFARPLQFAGYILDLAGHSLHDRDGADIPLTRGEFGLLREFVQRPGRVLSRDHLLGTLAGRDAEVYDRSIDMLVMRLRRKIELDPKRPSLIKTVPGSGYKFTSNVQDGAVGIAPGPGPASAALSPTIAILPFDNFSRETRWERFCDGLVEDIITDLARHPDLLVIARQSSSAYRMRTLDLREIGRALGARYVLEGSVQAEADYLKVTAQLINSASGFHIWADRYSREVADLFDIQMEIVDAVVAAFAEFGGAILQTELVGARRKPPAGLQAYELYLLGYEQEARLDRDGTLRSIELLDAAVTADPLFSRAWTVLAWAHGNAMQNGWATDAVVAAARRREAVLRAEQLDPNDGLAVMELGRMRLREGDLGAARDAFERALIVGANHADTLAFLAGYVAAVLGRPEQAVALMKRSFVLNPRAPTWYYLLHIRVAYFARLFELALDYFARLATDAATQGLPLRLQKLFKTLALAQLGRRMEATVAAQELYAVDPDLRVAEQEVAGLCPAARNLFLDGLHKAKLGSRQLLLARPPNKHVGSL